MGNPKFWVAVLAGGAVANIIDYIVMGMLLAPTFAGIESMRADTNPIWFVIGDFVSVFVLMLIYNRVYSSFTPGSKGGATYGMYMGLFASFPTWIFLHLMFKGFPYGLSWLLVIYGILWGVIVGSVLGSVYKK
jgi:hypothetical protein